MSGYRQIHTKIWCDGWFLEQDAETKLLYIYLFSNEQASVGGLYELPLRKIVFDTGLTRERTEALMLYLVYENKICYDPGLGVVWVINMWKYQGNSSPHVITRLQKDIKIVPECAVKTQFLQSSDMVSILYKDGTDTLSYSSSYSLSVVKEDRKDETADPFFTQIMTITGLMATANDIPLMTKWEKQGVIVADIQDAMKWRETNGRGPVKTISQLSGGVDISRLKRIQGENAKPGDSGRAKKPASTPIVIDKEWHP